MATDRVPAPDAGRPGVLQMMEEVVDLTAGLGVMLLPLLAISLPGVLLFFVLPGVLLAAVAAVMGALFAAMALPPYLLVRTVRRRRRDRVG